MFNLISAYYNKRFSNLYIIQNKNECKKDYLLIFGGTLYCIPNNEKNIDSPIVASNKTSSSSQIPLVYFSSRSFRLSILSCLILFSTISIILI